MTYLSIKEAAERIGVSASTLRNWDYNKSFPPARRMKGGKRQYTEEQINEFIEKKMKCE